MRMFDYTKVKDPRYFRDGRLEAHSDHMYYASESDLLTGVSEYMESLNGVWKFHYGKNYESAVQGFEKLDYSCADWDDIRVPAHIQMEGYDAPQYANTQYPWEGREDIRPGEIPERFNPTASYVKYFTVPERMQGKRLLWGQALRIYGRPVSGSGQGLLIPKLWQNIRISMNRY